MLYDSILEVIGKTPMVRLHRLGAGLDCNFFAKCEFLNPGGSVKDRIGYQMVIDAEAQGRIKPGDTLIEPTSGNTGIGLALAGAVRDYRVIITMPEKMSREKQVVLEALGARIVRTPTEAAWDSPESHIGVARRMQEELPNAHILDQYSNPSNPDAHYNHTGQEILDDMSPMSVDMVVMGAGTGGTITGVAAALKERKPGFTAIAVEPTNSAVLSGEAPGMHVIQGIGAGFVPEVLDTKLIDGVVKISNDEALEMARRLAKEEGLMCGISSGAAVAAAIKYGSEEGRDKEMIVVIIPSFGERYIQTKLFDPYRFEGSDDLGL